MKVVARISALFSNNIMMKLEWLFAYSIPGKAAVANIREGDICIQHNFRNIFSANVPEKILEMSINTTIYDHD